VSRTPPERFAQYLAEGEQAGLRYALGLPRQAPQSAAGLALSRRSGSSLEFRDYRDYQPGDDLRHIDWNAFARSDQLSIKLFREEVHPHLDVVLDASRSMDLEDTPKGRAAAALTAFFATAAGNAGFSHGAWLLAEQYRPVASSQAPPSQWGPLALDHRAAPGDVPGQVPAGLRPRGLRILISDLFWLGEPLATLRPLAEGSSGAVVVQLLAQADAQPAVTGNLRLTDAETGQTRDLHVDLVVLRRYQEALARHQQQWHRACQQVGAVFCTLIAETLVQDWRLDELVRTELLRVR
jgi:uncharacterized protein (DUF58 family)